MQVFSFKQYIIALVFMLFIDTVWLQLNKDFYSRAMSKVQKSTMVIKLPFAIVTYTIMAIGLYMILSDVNHYTNDKVKIIRAFIWGFVIYGVYNGTNLAVFKDYSIATALRDTLWGGILYALTIAIAIRI